MTISYLSIIIAALSTVVIAFLWYHPRVFGTQFMREVNLSPSQMETGKRRMMLYVFFSFLASIVAAYIMNYFAIAWGIFDWISALQLGITAWLGFTAVPMLGMVFWEMKSLKYYLIVSGYWLVSFIVMAQILLY